VRDTSFFWYNQNVTNERGDRVIPQKVAGRFMSGLVVKLFGFALICVFIVYLLASAFRNSRRLDHRIKEFKKEQEDLKNSGVILNPMIELANLYNEQEEPRRTSKKPSKRR